MITFSGLLKNVVGPRHPPLDVLDQLQDLPGGIDHPVWVALLHLPDEGIEHCAGARLGGHFERGPPGVGVDQRRPSPEFRSARPKRPTPASYPDGSGPAS